MDKLTSISVLAAACTTACGQEPPVDAKDQIPIACVLTALDAGQREREHALLAEHLAAVEEVREQPDGYSFRYRGDPALFSRMAELVALEHRCCPFLDFSLEWSRLQAAPWLHVGGGTRVKDFVRSTFAPAKR